MVIGVRTKETFLAALSCEGPRRTTLGGVVEEGVVGLGVDDEVAGVGFAAAIGEGGVFFVDGGDDVLGVLADAVVFEQVELPFEQAAEESAPAVAAAPDAGELADSAVAIEIDFVAAVAIAHPDGRHAGYDVVVVNPAIVGHFRVADISFAADSRRAEGVQFLRITGD